MTGTTQANGGLLTINGDLRNSALTINDGGTVGGTGTAGATIVKQGGRLAPGNSIGTLKINNSLTFEAGSQLDMEIDNTGKSDLIQVSGGTGAVTINGGKVNIIAAPGDYANGSRYTLLTTTGAITGKFDQIADNLAFLDSSLDYTDPSKIDLLLTRNATSFTDIATSKNQRATSRAVTSANIAALSNALTVLDANTARHAYDQLSGEAHASALGVVTEDSEFVRRTMAERLYKGEGGLWTQASGASRQVDGTSNSDSLSNSRTSTLVGYDRKLADSDWNLGVLGGYSNNKADTQGSDIKINSYHLGAYAGTHFDKLQLKLGAGLSTNRLDSKRDIAFGSYSSKEKSSYNATGLQGFAELGYAAQLGKVAVEPFINLAGVNVQRDGFKEKGDSAAQLEGKSTSTFTAFTTLGSRLRHGFTVGDRAVQLTGSVGLRHADGDVTPSSKNRFATGENFSVDGAPIARDVLVYEAGLSTQLAKDVTLGVSYAGQSSSDSQNHGGQVALNWAF
ncbi:MAG: autotransporter domain-containing protein [Pseudomonas sp.]